MKVGFRIGLVLAVLLAPLAARANPPDGQRVVALLDYVGGDYARAVKDGKVSSRFEYDEQLGFLADAKRLALPLAGDDRELLPRIDELEAKVKAVAPPHEVALASRAARDAAIRHFGLQTQPPGRPSLASAEKLYAQNCAACHGARGDGDTPAAAALDPRPADFRDPARRQALSPYRVYNTLTLGVPGTAMASWESLSVDDRWSLAFYVFRLGHAQDGAAAATAVDAAPAMPLAELARFSDGELLEDLQKDGVPDPQAALVHLRRETPFAAPRTGDAVAVARDLVRAAVLALPTDPAAAERHALDAYLSGFEPAEAQLAARDPRLVTDVERGFAALRAAIAKRDVAGAEEARRELEAALDRAQGGGGVLPFVAAFLIYFREGLECALLVGALLAGVRRFGRPEAARTIHQGWLAALAAGVATWFVAERLLHWTSLQRELLEAVVALLAAAVLFSVSFWMISRAESRRWTSYLQDRLHRGLGGRSRLVLAGLAFLAVYREAAETVLFTQALVLDAGARVMQVWAGAAAGLATTVVVALLMKTTVRRLPIGPFFAVSSLLLCGLAISFAGSGMNALVASGVLRPRPIAIPEVPWMGIHPDLAPLAVQLLIVAVIGWGAWTTLRRRGEVAEG